MRLALALAVLVLLIPGCGANVVENPETIYRSDDASKPNSDGSEQGTNGDVPVADQNNPDEVDVAEQPPSLPGVSPADIYLNLEKPPYSFEFGGWSGGKNFSSKCGSAIDLDTMADLNVCIYSRTGLDVLWVEAEVLGADIASAEWLLSYVATLPFDGNDPKASSEWVKANWKNVKQGEPLTQEVGGSIFTILGNPPTYVGLEITPQELEAWLLSLPID